MTEQTFAPPKRPLFTGDAVSQLVQVIVRDVNLQGFKATGKGDADVRQLAIRAFNSFTERQELWNGIADLLKLIDTTPGLPESFLAGLSATVLRTRANIDLKSLAQ